MTKYIPYVLILMSSAVANAELIKSYTFISEGNTGVGAQGSVVFFDDRVEVTVENLSYLDNGDGGEYTRGAITGLWLYEPSDDDGDLISANKGDVDVSGDANDSGWNFKNQLTSQVKQQSDDRSYKNYFGADKSGNPNSNSVNPGTSVVFTFDLDYLFGIDDLLYDDPSQPTGPDIVLRWQSVGDDMEGSDKTVAMLIAGDLNPVPEPGTIAGLGLAVLGLAIVRRNRKARGIKG